MVADKLSNACRKKLPRCVENVDREFVVLLYVVRVVDVCSMVGGIEKEQANRTFGLVVVVPSFARSGARLGNVLECVLIGAREVEARIHVVDVLDVVFEVGVFGNHASKGNHSVDENVSLGFNFNVVRGEHEVVGAHSGLGRNRVSNGRSELAKGSFTGISSFASIQSTGENVGSDELGLVVVVVWKLSDFVCFVNARMDPFSEGSANVACSQVEVSAQVTKIRDNLDSVVDVVPDKVAQGIPNVVAGRKKEGLGGGYDAPHADDVVDEKLELVGEDVRVVLSKSHKDDVVSEDAHDDFAGNLCDEDGRPHE